MSDEGLIINGMPEDEYFKMVAENEVEAELAMEQAEERENWLAAEYFMEQAELEEEWAAAQAAEDTRNFEYLPEGPCELEDFKMAHDIDMAMSGDPDWE